MILFGDLNVDAKDIDKKIYNKIKSFGFNIYYNKNEFTRNQIVNNIEKNHI